MAGEILSTRNKFEQNTSVETNGNVLELIDVTDKTYESLNTLREGADTAILPRNLYIQPYNLVVHENEVPISQQPCSVKEIDITSKNGRPGNVYVSFFDLDSGRRHKVELGSDPNHKDIRFYEEKLQKKAENYVDSHIKAVLSGHDFISVTPDELLSGDSQSNLHVRVAQPFNLPVTYNKTLV